VRDVNVWENVIQRQPSECWVVAEAREEEKRWTGERERDFNTSIWQEFDEILREVKKTNACMQPERRRTTHIDARRN
jgi:hypothetical protein